MLLYLNFDGVLHPNSVVFGTHPVPVLEVTGHRLFENVDALARITSLFPSLRFVLNTWWTYRIEFDQCLKKLPRSVASRTVGAILPHFTLCASTPNRVAMATNAAMNSMVPVILLDHADARYPKSLLPNAFLLDPYLGLWEPQVIDAFVRFITQASKPNAIRASQT